MGQPISGGHFILDIRANLLKEYAMMITQLLTTLRTGALTVWES